ncbi:Chaperone protein HscA [Nocardia sp. RB56]|uniref:Chaperone protein HscA n=1 Tax=Nocardia aurantia TaxID=2585199 RepID=A0A7K0DYU7_9NOCA|nr:Chaperone protein HscA [Nocardia aurantia]
MGAGAVRVARPHAGNTAEWFTADRFDVQNRPVEGLRPEDLAAEIISGIHLDTPDLEATAVGYRDDQHGRGLRAALARRQLVNYELVPEVLAAVEFLLATGELQGYRTIALYDLGSSGLTVSVVDLATRQVHYSERTSDIGGDYLDTLIREQQIASGRIAHPADPAGLTALDALCRRAKEQLSGNTAVALPSEYGLVLISQENFEALIQLAVESSARLTREVITRSEQAVQAVVAIGGCARIPLVSKTVGRWTGMPVVVPAQPETVVARGASLLARPSVLAAPTRPVPMVATAPRSAKSQLAKAKSATNGPDAEEGRREPGASRRRELSVAGVAVGALVVIAALGSALGWGPQVLQGDSQSSNAQSSSAVTTTVPLPVIPTGTRSPDDPTNASIAAPPPQYSTTTTDAPSTTPGPNTIVVVPGLPPIVVPTIPPVVLPPLLPNGQRQQPQQHQR